MKVHLAILLPQETNKYILFAPKPESSKQRRSLGSSGQSYVITDVFRMSLHL